MMTKFLLGAVVTMALVPLPAIAQDVSQTSGIFEVTPSPASEVLDYHLLYNNTFNHIDIDDAKAFKYSDRQIATIYKIAKLRRTSFSFVLDKLRRGETFATIADEESISLNQLRDVRKEEEELAAYYSAYAATGLGDAPRPNRVESSIDSTKPSK